MQDFVIDGTVLLKYTGKEKTVTIPDGITEIGKGAFAFCGTLRKVILPYGVEKIGYTAFSTCASLREVELPETLLEIGTRAFIHCKRLSKIVLPECKIRGEEKIGGLRHIGSQAFYGCEALREIEIPVGVVGIGPNAFENCTALRLVIIAGTLTYTPGFDIPPKTEGDILFNIGAKKHLFEGTKKVEVLCYLPSIPVHWDAEWNKTANGDIIQVSLVK